MKSRNPRRHRPTRLASQAIGHVLRRGVPLNLSLCGRAVYLFAGLGRDASGQWVAVLPGWPDGLKVGPSRRQVINQLRWAALRDLNLVSDSSDLDDDELAC